MYLIELLGFVQKLMGELLDFFVVPVVRFLLRHLQEFINIQLIFMLEQVADFFELLQALVGAMYHDVVHNIHQVLVKVVACCALCTAEQGPQIVEVLDLPCLGSSSVVVHSGCHI